ncbi:hypothetical protein [Burkholderia sp. PAMC 26561]|uniref:hypothetical protein n=1 Tax=Burkholderia sp. PAMC 26561 TaxID=1795043 RepID=UPI00076B591F|nr:hypothetical protein [Burkholderia sp. PAMC 26561]AME28298.1 hypothetical protein AXG89_31240 [Burkholderia sp. PAMC 26561]
MRDVTGRTVAAISVTGTSEYTDETLTKQLVSVVRRVARAISEWLGGRQETGGRGRAGGIRLHQAKHDSLKEGRQIAPRVHHEVNENHVASHLINDSVLAGKDLRKTVFEHALKLAGKCPVSGNRRICWITS